MIVHLDLDAFFASCERLLNPGLKNRPIAVGGRGDPFIFDPKSRHDIDVTLEKAVHSSRHFSTMPRTVSETILSKTAKSGVSS
jgi:hypothetical protein